MHTTVLSSKGQVIIPKVIRTARRWAPGTQLEVHETPDGLLLKPVVAGRKVGLARGLAAIRGRIGTVGQARTLAEMDTAVLHEAARRASRG